VGGALAASFAVFCFARAFGGKVICVVILGFGFAPYGRVTFSCVAKKK